jgi:hypothetical protein
MSKCDFCEKEAVHFGSHASAQACQDHIKKAEDVEDAMYSAMVESQSIPQDPAESYFEFLRQT